MSVWSWLPRALFALLAVIILSEIAVIAPRWDTGVLLGAAIWMAVPGVVLTWQLFRSRDPSRVAAFLFGPALGLGFSVFGVFLFWAAGLQNWLAIVLGPGLSWTLVAVARQFGGPSLRLPTFDRRDWTAVAILLLVVPLITWKPYDHVRERVADGEAYRAYFTADFIWAMTVTSEISKGKVPPDNPFLGGQPMHYYWMAHFLSGAEYRNVKASAVLAEHVILVNGLVFGLAFVGFSYGLARATGGGPAGSALAVAAGFLANSYEGADMIRAIIQHGEPWSELTTVNIDAVSRWFYKGMAVDGLHRLLLYQPHHLTGYALALAALWLVSLAEDVTETSVALSAGILLGLAVLFSTFTAMIVGAAVGLLFAIRLVQQHAMRATLQCALLGAAPVVVGVVLSKVFGYTDDRYGFLLIFGLNPVAVHHAGRVIVLSFGPLLFAGAASLMRWRWLLAEGTAPAALTVASFGFYFFTNVPDSGNVWVGWRSGHLLLIAFAAMGAATLSAAWRARRLRLLLAITVALVLVLAVPTVAIDVYNAQDITNRGDVAGFPWTLIITPDEREALEWIRRETPEHAVVQLEPWVRGPAHWAYMPAFGERRMIAGLPISMTPRKPYQDASDQVYGEIFRARTADEAYRMARFLGIDYLALGIPERRAYREGIAHMVARPDLFARVFRNDEMTVFRVVR